jgi:hypothetical protein
MGFEAEIEGWEVISVSIEKLDCKIEGFPKNREEFLTLQYGEFTKYYDFNDNELVAFIDSDMILQREFTLGFDYGINNKFLVTNSSFPPTKLKDVIKNLGCKIPVESIINRYGITGEEGEFCSGFLVARVGAWKELFNSIKTVLPVFFDDFEHHAAWQLIVNMAILIDDKLDYITLNPIICNADWYSGTKAIKEDGVLMYNGDKVYFNHSKFN